MDNFPFCFFVVVLIALSHVKAQVNPPIPKDNIEADLISYLQEIYPGEGLARPMENFTTPYLTVNISMYISDFDDLDDLNGLLILSGRVVAKWSDNNLKWLPEDYDNIDKVQLRAATVWLPPVVQYNYAPDLALPLFSSGGTDSLATVWIKATGEVTAIHAGPLITKCSIDLTRFPFDSQQCSYIYTTYAYTYNVLHFEPGVIAFINGEPDPAAVWTIDSYTCSATQVSASDDSRETYAGVKCDLKLIRRSTWYIVNFFVPSLFLAVLQLSSFFMPLGEGRASFCITVVLAFAVFQTVFATLLPKTSSTIPLVNYLVIQMVVGTVAALNAIYAYHFYETGVARDREVPSCLRWIFKLYANENDENEETESLKALLNTRKMRLKLHPKVENDVKQETEYMAIPKGLPRRADTASALHQEQQHTLPYMINMADQHAASLIQTERAFYADASRMIGAIAIRQLRRLKHDDLEQQWMYVARFFDAFVGIMCLLTTVGSTVALFWPLYIN